MSSIITSLQNKRLIWRAGRAPVCLPEQIPSGYHEVDEALDGGWPQTGVIAIQGLSGIGELRLVVPGLLPQKQESTRLIVFISPPWCVNAEMLYEQGFELKNIVVLSPNDNRSALWSAEQCLKSGCCAAVLLWPEYLQTHQVKRLQLAAEHGHALSFLLSHRHIFQGLPLALYLVLSPTSQGLEVKVHKRRGGWPVAPFHVDMSSRWPNLTHQCQPDSLTHLPLQEAGL